MVLKDLIQLISLLRLCKGFLFLCWSSGCFHGVGDRGFDDQVVVHGHAEHAAQRLQGVASLRLAFLSGGVHHRTGCKKVVKYKKLVKKLEIVNTLVMIHAFSVNITAA